QALGRLLRTLRSIRSPLAADTVDERRSIASRTLRQWRREAQAAGALGCPSPAARHSLHERAPPGSARRSICSASSVLLPSGHATAGGFRTTSVACSLDRRRRTSPPGPALLCVRGTPAAGSRAPRSTATTDDERR